MSVIASLQYGGTTEQSNIKIVCYLSLPRPMYYPDTSCDKFPEVKNVKSMQLSVFVILFYP